MLVRSDHGAVDDHPLQVGVLQFLEDPLPHPLLGPPVEPLPDRTPRPEPLGQVAPRGPGLGDPEDGVDEEAVVLGGDAGVAGLAGEHVLDAYPVLVLDLMAAHGGHSCRETSWQSLPILLKTLRICLHGLRLLANTLRILFLDDSPARALAFLRDHPEAVWVRTAKQCLVRLAEPW